MGNTFISRRTGGKMVRITVTISEEIFERIEREAKLFGLSRSGMVEKALNTAIPKYRRTSRKKVESN